MGNTNTVPVIHPYSTAFLMWNLFLKSFKCVDSEKPRLEFRLNQCYVATILQIAP